jgi:hypothetical protein
MPAEPGPASAAPSRSEILRILSPLLLFVAHVVYLVAWSPDPFLKKWLDGSFTFFVALVLCNIVRSRVVAQRQAREAADADDAGDGPDDGDSDPSGPAGAGSSSR